MEKWINVHVIYLKENVFNGTTRLDILSRKVDNERENFFDAICIMFQDRTLYMREVTAGIRDVENGTEMTLKSMFVCFRGEYRKIIIAA